MNYNSTKIGDADFQNSKISKKSRHLEKLKYHSDSKFYADFSSVLRFSVGFHVDLQFVLKVINITIKLTFGQQNWNTRAFGKMSFIFESSTSKSIDWYRFHPNPDKPWVSIVSSRRSSLKISICYQNEFLTLRIDLRILPWTILRFLQSVPFLQELILHSSFWS